MRRRNKILSLPYVPEQLETRDLLSAATPVAVPWPEIDSLRISFVPDGTQAGDAVSDLFQTLERVAPGLDWQLEVLRGFQTWAKETNANIGIVTDHGQPIGTLGFKQGDVRFGDVRIGAFPMENDVLAVANPYDPFIANTWVGDVFLNSGSALSATLDDPVTALYAIMLHEAGHVFGMSHSPDIASPMFASFQHSAKPLTTEDIALLRTLYGARRTDEWEGILGNGSLATASNISLMNEGGQLTAAELRGDITSTDDVDTYVFQVPAATTSFQVQLHASGISLLTAKVSVLNPRGEVVATSSATDPRTNNLSVLIPDAEVGGSYFVRVESADRSVFGVGAYQLLVTPLSDGNAASPLAKSHLGNDIFPDFSPEQLLATTPGYVEHTYYEVQGMLSLAHVSQVFRVRSPDIAEELDNVFTIVVSAESGSIDDLSVSVTDTNGVPLPFEVVPSQNGKLELQFADALSGVDYLVSIDANDPQNVKMIYELEVDFAHDAHQFETVVMGSLSEHQPEFEQAFHVARSGQHHFVISASDWSDPRESGLQMRVLDSDGRMLADTAVNDGHSIWLDVFLNQGDYIFEFSSPRRLDSASVLFQLNVAAQSIPIGPQLRDTLREPVKSTQAATLVPLANHWVPGLVFSERSDANFPAHIRDRRSLPIQSGLPHPRHIEMVGYSVLDGRSTRPPIDADEPGSLVESPLARRRWSLRQQKSRNTESNTEPARKSRATSDSECAPQDNVPATDIPVADNSQTSMKEVGDQGRTARNRPPVAGMRRLEKPDQLETEIYFSDFSTQGL
ncbi:MAG: matrixin family metalloprotease [Planctomycetaceae bacterium]|nr:matrixin family metalloprotease [Planctomycetaceae bacterium]